MSEERDLTRLQKLALKALRACECSMAASAAKQEWKEGKGYYIDVWRDVPDFVRELFEEANEEATEKGDTKTVVVFLEGGLVEVVLSDFPEHAQCMVVDTEVEHCGSEDMFLDPRGELVFKHTVPVVSNPEFVRLLQDMPRGEKNIDITVLKDLRDLLRTAKEGAVVASEAERLLRKLEYEMGISPSEAAAGNEDKRARRIL